VHCADASRSTYQAGNINAVLLVATAHGEVCVEVIEVVLGVSLWDSLLVLEKLTGHVGGTAYVEKLDVVENVIVEGEVVAGNDIDAGILLDLPVLETNALGLLQQIVLGDLASPVSLVGLLQLTVAAHAGEPEY
jgi:hypothetical protein